MTTERLRAVLFDFDGTLWDSETAVFGAMRHLYRRHGHELSLETWSKAIGTAGGFDPYAALHELTGAGFDLDGVRTSTEERIRRAAHRVTMRPGVEAFLRQLDRAGVRRALVSSDTISWLRTHLERMGWWEGWAAMVCADGIAAHAKPRPYLYSAALEMLGVPATATFAVEDSPHGIRAARAAGVSCVCVPNEVTAQLDLSEADVVFPSFEGLTVEAVWSELKRATARPFRGTGTAEP